MAAQTIRSGIQTFLNARVNESAFLIPRWSPDLESQILVIPGAVPTSDSGREWTDGEQIWKDHRWPHNASSDPYYNDKQLTFSPGEHVKRIGSTWWNYITKQSHAVAIDIDVEGEHAESTTTVNMSKLDELIELLKKLPYLTLVRSTGGNGLHVYVFFDEEHRPTAQNHNEHAQYGSAVLAKICEDTGYDFNQHVDVKGNVFWFWGNDSPEEGFSLIQDASVPMKAAELEPYHKVKISTPTQSVTFSGYTEGDNKVEETSDEYEVYELDETHKQILKALEQTQYKCHWIDQYNMMQTHTRALAEVFESVPGMKGKFETISAGKNPDHPNCYITPRRNGVFKVVRFGNGTTEHGLWLSNKGKTYCYYNQEVAPMTVMRKYASKTTASSLTFDSVDLKKALEVLGKDIGEFPEDKPVRVTWGKDGAFKAKIRMKEGSLEGWSRNGENLERELGLVHKAYSPEYIEPNLEIADTFCRHIQAEDGTDLDWAFNNKSEVGWVPVKKTEGINRSIKVRFKDCPDEVLDAMFANPWTLVHRPFEEEYPGGRKWNWNAPQLKVKPSEVSLPHPTWDMYLNTLGQSLDDVISRTEWCSRWGIYRGGDYLRFWLACLIQFPFDPLPYLFLYGAQNTGKSMLYELMEEMLFTEGSVFDASTAMQNKQTFNKELETAVVAYLNEINLSNSDTQAYATIKRWTTDRKFLVHPKNGTPYARPNTLHFIQTANSPLYCPVEDGDTRVVVIEVPPLKNPIPRNVLDKKLETEVAAFLRTLVNTNIPEPLDRMRLPVLETEAKKDIVTLSYEQWETFASENLVEEDGMCMSFRTFYDKYQEWCVEKGLKPESMRSVSTQMRNKSETWLVGYYTNKQLHIGNVRFQDDDDEAKGSKYVLNEKGRLCRDA